jgi:hypothetical protein
MRRILCGFLLSLLLLFPLTVRAAPEGDIGEKLRQVEELTRLLEQARANQSVAGVTFEDKGKNVLRVYNVADLTVRLTSFIAPNLLVRPAGAEVDESQPLFGKSQEGEIFFAGTEHLMDLILTNVLPDLWDVGSSTINASGPHGIVVTGEPLLQAAVTDYLAELRRSVGRTVTVELRVIEAPTGALPLQHPGAPTLSLTQKEGLAILAKAESGGDVRIIRSARITGYNGQQVSLYRGAQRSFVQDWDVEVAQEASISDPIVGIVQDGFAFDVRPIVRDENLIVVDLRAQRSEHRSPIRTVVSTSGPVQAPDMAYSRVNTTLTVPNGGFALAGSGPGQGSGGWYLLLSATAEKIVSGGGR